MGQRCLRYAVGGTPDLLEALCRNASGEESVETQTACRAVLAGDRAWGLPVLARARGRCGCRLRELPASQAGRLPGRHELSNISKSR